MNFLDIIYPPTPRIGESNEATILTIAIVVAALLLCLWAAVKYSGKNKKCNIG